MHRAAHLVVCYIVFAYMTIYRKCDLDKISKPDYFAALSYQLTKQ